MHPRRIVMALAIAACCLGCSEHQVPSGSNRTAIPGRESIANPALLIDPPEAIRERYRFLEDPWFNEAKYKKGIEELPYTEIQLERTECFGTCPSYIVVFRIDGTATYEGREYVDKQGKHAGRIYSGGYARLCWAIEQFKVLDGPRSYSVNMTDMSTAILRIKRRDTDSAEEIRDYGGAGPMELWIIQNAIDGISSRVEWKKMGDE